jgi:hypothetical protein
MSGDWRRLHRVRGVSGGSSENHWVPWLIHKAKTEEPKTGVQQHRTGLTSGSDRSDRCRLLLSFARVNVWVSSLLSCVAVVSSLGQFGAR